MGIVQPIIVLFSLSVVGILSSSIGSEFESLNTCSKFHFEERVLEKLVRLEHKVQIFEEKMDAWEKSITSKSDEMNNIKKQTEKFVQSVQDAQLQDQTRLNDSYQESVNLFKAKANNETSFYGDQMHTLLQSLSSKIQLFSEAEKKRESSLDLMEKRFNISYDQIVETVKVNSNETLQEIILKQQTDYNEMVKKRETVAFSVYSPSEQSLTTGKKVLFSQVWTNVGNGYEPITGTFTAPKAGLYHFTAVVKSTNRKDLYLRLYHNTLAISGSHVDCYGYKTGTFDVILDLKKGDRVFIGGKQIGAIYIDPKTYLTFSGHSVW